jgi:hypothetical protein
MAIGGRLANLPRSTTGRPELLAGGHGRRCQCSQGGPKEFQKTFCTSTLGACAEARPGSRDWQGRSAEAEACLSTSRLLP